MSTTTNLEKNPFIADIDWDEHYAQMLAAMSPERRDEHERNLAQFAKELEEEQRRYRSALHRRLIRAAKQGIAAARASWQAGSATNAEDGEHSYA